MHQQLWGYRVKEKLNLGVREQKRLNTTGIEHLGNMWVVCSGIAGGVQVVQSPQAADTNGQKNEYFKLKELIFCPQQILCYWAK
jgi:hypothetical protein